MTTFARAAQYRIQNRYQDSGWNTVLTSNKTYEADELGDAARRAEELSRDAIVWGMCRVQEIHSGMVVVEFPAGHPAYRVTVANGAVVLVEAEAANPGLWDGLVGYWDATLGNVGPGAYCGAYPVANVRELSGSSLGFVDRSQYPHVGLVTAPGPDLPAIENRAPRGIHLRDRGNEED